MNAGSLSLRRTASTVLLSRRLSNGKQASSNVLNSFVDYFGDLRVKAANALTDSLSEEDRQRLLKRLDGVDANGAQQELEKTVGEAVAAAKIEEAQRQESQWQQEKDRLFQEAEEAARARIESDLRLQERQVALERWNKDLQEEISAKETKPDHPLLGRMLHDFGTKQIYSVSAKQLATLPVWKKQRIYRHDRAKFIAKDKRNTPHLGMPGIIVLHEDTEGRLTILDGQHRVGAMAVLAEKGDAGIDLDNILVEVHSSSTKESDTSVELFTEINKAEPVKLVDMPGVATKGEQNIINGAAESMKARFPDMFKQSQQCRSPHLNIDNLRDALFGAEIIKKHQIKSPKKLVEWMMAQNETLAVHFRNEENQQKVNKNALAKAVKYDFYLGLDSSWLYH